jgi:hypothetical protein
MQDIITQEILKHSLISFEVGKKIIDALFEEDYKLPEEISKRRPSFLNFNNVLKWGGSVENAHISALSCLNSDLGCFGGGYFIIKTYFEDQSDNKEHTREVIYSLLNTGKKIQGFGNPIYKGLVSTDERCIAVRKTLYENLPVKEDVDDLISLVKECVDKPIDANLVFWNALSIYLLGLTKEYASLVFILATQIRYINSLHDTNIEQ